MKKFIFKQNDNILIEIESESKEDAQECFFKKFGYSIEEEDVVEEKKLTFLNKIEMILILSIMIKICYDIF